MTVFHENLGQLVPLDFFLHIAEEKPLKVTGTVSLQTGCPCCHPINSVKVIKETHSTDPDQRETSTGPILSHLPLNQSCPWVHFL